MQDTTNTFDLRLFNGLITVTNTRTGNHQVYRIHTEKKTWKKADGVERTERFRKIAKKVTRKHGSWDFVNFAKIDDNGLVFLFPEFRDAQHRVHVSILLHPERQAEEHGLDYQVSCTCRICGRALTHPDSIKSGIGPVCIGYVGLSEFAKKIKRMSDEERFSELRSACHGKRMGEALIAFGYIDEPKQRDAAKHYINAVYRALYREIGERRNRQHDAA